MPVKQRNFGIFTDLLQNEKRSEADKHRRDYLKRRPGHASQEEHDAEMMFTGELHSVLFPGLFFRHFFSQFRSFMVVWGFRFGVLDWGFGIGGFHLMALQNFELF